MLARPFGAEGVHPMEPRCPAEDMGSDQPKGGGWPATGAFTSRRGPGKGSPARRRGIRRADISPDNSRSVEAVENSKMKERCGNVTENKGSGLEDREGSGNVIENKGSYVLITGMSLKIRQLVNASFCESSASTDPPDSHSGLLSERQLLIARCASALACRIPAPSFAFRSAGAGLKVAWCRPEGRRYADVPPSPKANPYHPLPRRNARKWLGATRSEFTITACGGRDAKSLSGSDRIGSGRATRLGRSRKSSHGEQRRLDGRQ